MNVFLQEFRSGWRDLIGATIGLGCGIGCYTPVSSLFFRALEHEFGWSKAAAAASFVALPLTAAVLPFAGSLLDRFGVRRIAPISAFLMSVFFLWLSAMGGQLLVFYAAFIGLNVLGCATGPVGYTRTIAHRFRFSRGTALAIALLGIASAGMLLPPILASVMAASGWRAAYRLLAIIVLVGGGVAGLLIQPREAIAETKEGLSGDLLAMAVRRKSFWLLGIAIFGVTAGSLGFVSQFQSVMIEKGLPLQHATLLLSLLAASVFASRLVVGWALDVLRAERVAASVLALAALGMGIWLVGGSGLPVALATIVLIGLSIGGELDLMSFFCARLFGLRHYGAIYGALAVFFYCGIAAGGVAYGGIHDITGSYAGAIALSGLLFLLSSILFLWLRSASDAALKAVSLEGPIGSSPTSG